MCFIYTHWGYIISIHIWAFPICRAYKCFKQMFKQMNISFQKARNNKTCAFPKPSTNMIRVKNAKSVLSLNLQTN